MQESTGNTNSTCSEYSTITIDNNIGGFRTAGFRTGGFWKFYHSNISPPTRLQSKKREKSTYSLSIGTVLVQADDTAWGFSKGNNSLHFSPVNIYVGENFSVWLQQWFKFLTYIEDNKNGGIVHCDFSPNRSLARMTLSADGTKIRDVPNAGGSSVISEILSFELLQKCFKAKLLKTEMEVSYFPEGGSITDYVCEIFGTKVGVSVTRAMKFRGGPFTDEDAQHLLTKKLNGVIQSSRNSLEKWNKQVLHVWSMNNDTTNTLVKMYETLPVEVMSNTVVLVTTTTQSSDFIYLNG